MSQPESLFTKEFIALNVVFLFSFCNLAVFFHFHQYLHTLPIAPQWFGLLIALFSLLSLILRPIISPFLHPGNARKWMFISCIVVIAFLLAYSFARSFFTMALVRILHGVGFVGQTTAMMALVVRFIPPKRSGQAFGLLSVSTLLPYAVVPPILDPLTLWLGGFNHVLNLTALLMLLVFPLLLVVRVPSTGSSGETDLQKPIRAGELAENLKNRRVLLLLIITLVFFTGFTPVFFFLKRFASDIGIQNAGLFFTLAFVTMIIIRVTAGPLFDRLSKIHVLGWSIALVAFGYMILAQTSGHFLFYGLGVFLGLGWGVAMPLFDALMFDISLNRFQGLNINLAIEMVDGGFFLGPLMGGMVLSLSGYAGLFYVCGVVTLASLVLLFFMGGKAQS
ncbi:MAG: MFS transporter [Deltaproteobacteria bacterium]|nr:MFS transporter [Deltaproteobacteria bacterium]